MATTEIYPDGSKINKFFSANSIPSLSKKFGDASLFAFMNGAERVEQRIVRGNEVCPMCDSGLRFDLCCGAKESA